MVRGPSVLVEVLLREVLGRVLMGVGPAETLNCFALPLDRSVRIATLCTEDFPQPLVFVIRDPVSVYVKKPAAAHPTCVREMVVGMRGSIAMDRFRVLCSNAKADREVPAADDHGLSIEGKWRL
jgi:hypothetical protein